MTNEVLNNKISTNSCFSSPQRIGKGRIIMSRSINYAPSNGCFRIVHNINDVQCTTGHNLLKMWESEVGALQITKSCVLEEFYAGP